MDGREHFDGGLRADRGKDRRWQVAVGGMEEAHAGASFFGEDVVFEHGGIVNENAEILESPLCLQEHQDMIFRFYVILFDAPAFLIQFGLA